MKKLMWAMMAGSLVVNGASAAGEMAKDEDVKAIAKVVFAGTKGMPEAAQLAVAQQLASKRLRADKGQLTDARCGVMPHKTHVLDLNKDGVSEALVFFGNACRSGKIGQTVYLFTQEAEGKVQRHMGFSASGYKLLPREGEAWPDILFEGTGNCQPVWRYKGGRYGFNHLFEVAPGGCYVPQSDNFGG